MTLSQDIGQLIRKMRKQGLAMMHTHYDMVIDMKEAVDIFAQLHTRSWILKIWFSSRFVTVKYVDYIVLEILCIEIDGIS